MAAANDRPGVVLDEPRQPAYARAGAAALERGTGIALAAALGALWIGCAILPGYFNGVTAGFLGLLLAAPLLAWAIATRPPRRPAVALLSFAAIPVLALALSAVAAVNPNASFLGYFTQREGWMYWFGLYAWFAAAVIAGDERDIAWLARVIAAAAAVAALFAFADAAGLVQRAVHWSPTPAGMFGSSVALGQTMLLGLGASAWMYFDDREAWVRPAAVVTGLLCIGGALVSQSRGTLLGLVVAAAAIPILLWGGRDDEHELLKLLGWVVLTLVGIGLVVAALGSLGLLTNRFYGFLDTLSAHGIAVWRSTVYSILEHPFVGRGPSQFTAYASWDVGPDLWPVGVLTTEPGGSALGWIAMTGVVGLAAILIAAWRVVPAIVRAWNVRPRTLAEALLAAGVAGYAASTLVSWIDPLGGFSTVLLVGVLLAPALRAQAAEAAAATGAPASGTPKPRWAGVAAGVAGIIPLALLVALAPSALAEYRIGLTDPGSSARTAALQAGAASGDPEVAVALAGAYTSGSDPAGPSNAAAVLDRVSRDAAWNADVAYAIADTAWALQAQDRATGHTLFVDAVRSGRRADPATGLWDYLALRGANATGASGQQHAYAKAILQAPHSQAVADAVSKLLTGK